MNESCVTFTDLPLNISFLIIVIPNCSHIHNITYPKCKKSFCQRRPYLRVRLKNFNSWTHNGLVLFLLFFSRQYVASYFETNKNKNEIEEWMNWMQYNFFCFLSLEDSIGAPERLRKLAISPLSFYGISIFHFQTCLISSEE